MYKLIVWGQTHGKYNHAEFICDNQDDIESIDMSKCAPGSIVYYVEGDGSKKVRKYILTPSRNLVEFIDSAGSSSTIDVDVATTTETSSYLNI